VPHDLNVFGKRHLEIQVCSGGARSLVGKKSQVFATNNLRSPHVGGGARQRARQRLATAGPAHPLFTRDRSRAGTRRLVQRLTAATEGLHMSEPALNYLTPDGRIVALKTHGAWLGNRHQVPDIAASKGVRRRGPDRTWLICAGEHPLRRIRQRREARSLELYFLDEASAFAAGHRPCAECRRSSYNDYRTKWAWAHPGIAPYASHIDADLHSQRLPDAQGRRPLLDIPWPFVPTGAFVVLASDRAAVVLDDLIAPYDEVLGRYLPALERPTSGCAQALTPPSTLAVLQRGYAVQIDPSATAQV
jgi:hypothetical protein